MINLEDLKVEIVDILEKQDQLQIEFSEINKTKEEKAQKMFACRQSNDLDGEKQLKVEIFDLIEKLEILKYQFNQLDQQKQKKYEEINKLRGNDNAV